MLVAASMPALPAASRNLRSGVLCSVANSALACDDAVERLGAVVGEIGDHRHHRAVGVEQVGVVDAGLLRAVVENVLVARDRQPLRRALVAAGGDLAHRVGQARGRLHARQLLQRPGQAIGLDQGLVLEAAFLLGLDDHREGVARQRVVAGDVGVVAVVARVGAQLGRARDRGRRSADGGSPGSRRRAARPRRRWRRAPSASRRTSRARRTGD